MIKAVMNMMNEEIAKPNEALAKSWNEHELQIMALFL